MLTIGYRFIVFQNISFKIYTFLHAFESICRSTFDRDISKACILDARTASSGVERRWPLILFVWKFVLSWPKSLMVNEKYPFVSKPALWRSVRHVIVACQSYQQFYKQFAGLMFCLWSLRSSPFSLFKDSCHLSFEVNFDHVLLKLKILVIGFADLVRQR